MARVALVLGGGGMKGLAHVGAWKAREEGGVEVVGIVGTSIGALVGAALAGGLGWRELAPRALGLARSDIIAMNRWVVMPMGIRQPALFAGERFREYVRRTLPVHRFEDLRIPLTVNAVDLETGRVEWFGAGGRLDVTVPDAVSASAAMPVFFPPVELGGRYYVDGGVSETLPLSAVSEAAVDAVVAVDVAAGGEKDPRDTLSKGMVAVHHRVYDIMAYARKVAQLEAWNGPPLIYVRPALDGYSTFDFERVQYFLEEGYRATRRALRSWSTASVPEISA